MRASTAIGVDNDFASGQTAITLRAADHKTTGRVDQVTCVFQPFFGQHRLDDFFDHGFNERGFHLGRCFALVRAVLRREHHGVNAVGFAVHITHGHLALCVRAQKRHAAVAAQLRLALDQSVRVVNRGGHQVWGFFDRITKHQPLVTGAGVQVVIGRVVHALRDVVGLFVIANHDGATFVVNAVLGVVIADALNRVTRDLYVVDMRVGGDFTGQHHQAGVGQCFGCHAAARVLFKNSIQNSVRNLIGHFIGVAFRDGFRGK